MSFSKAMSSLALPSDPAKVGHRTEPQRLLKQLTIELQELAGIPGAGQFSRGKQ